MRTHKQLFILNIPLKNLIHDVSKHTVHIFAKTLSGTVLIANDVQAEYFGSKNARSLQGQNYTNLLPISESNTLKLNDTIAINSNIPYLCHETCLNKPAISIKAKLKNSSNNTIGVGGVAFYPHQITQKDMIAVIKMLDSLFLIDDFTNAYTFNAPLSQKLTYRQKTCIYHLMRGRTYKEIAKILKISPRTVETHIEHIKNKLGCYSRADIINKFFEEK